MVLCPRCGSVTLLIGNILCNVTCLGPHRGLWRGLTEYKVLLVLRARFPVAMEWRVWYFTVPSYINYIRSQEYTARWPCTEPPRHGHWLSKPSIGQRVCCVSPGHRRTEAHTASAPHHATKGVSHQEESVQMGYVPWPLPRPLTHSLSCPRPYLGGWSSGHQGLQRGPGSETCCGCPGARRGLVGLQGRRRSLERAVLSGRRRVRAWPHPHKGGSWLGASVQGKQGILSLYLPWPGQEVRPQPRHPKHLAGLGGWKRLSSCQALRAAPLRRRDFTELGCPGGSSPPY